MSAESEGIEVRPAEPADWEAVSGLLAELGRPDVRGTPQENEAREIFESYLARDNTAALVAVVESSVVGFVDMEFRTWLNFTRPQAWIPDLIVTEQGRSRGAGAALLAAAEEVARERDCWGMSLESASWRERAHAFYIREGWTESGKAFTKSLTGEPWPPPPRP